MITIFTPTFNRAYRLPDLYHSLQRQTNQDFEWLVIDDGSTDNTSELFEKWKMDESFPISYIKQPNGGKHRAINRGVKEAKGEFFYIVDSDDFWVNKDCLENLMNVVDAHPECDFIGFNCSYYYSDSNTFNKWVVYDECLSKPTEKDIVLRSLVASGTFPMSACLKILKRKALSDMNLRFIKGTIAEDIPWFIDLLDGSKCCMFINQYIYAYRQNVAGSITASGNPKSTNDLFTIVKNEVNKMNERSFSEEAKNALYSFLAYEFCILLTASSRMSKEMRKELMQYKWLLNYTANPKVRKAAFVNKLFGIKVTELMLKFYTNYIRK